MGFGTGDNKQISGKSVSFAVGTNAPRHAGQSAWTRGPPMGSMASRNPAPAPGQTTTPAAAQLTGRYMPPQRRTAGQSAANSTSQATSMMQNMSISSAPQKPLTIEDPSQAPGGSIAPSMMTTFKPRAYTGSRFSTARPDDNSRRRKWIKNKVCKKSPWIRSTFEKGHVIALPYHVPNMNENCDVNDKGLTINQDYDCGIFTKRRMMVVLFKHAELMYCLPLYSFTGRGIGSRRPDTIHEYVQLMDTTHREYFTKEGKHKPVEFRHKSEHSSLLPSTVVHITGGMSVNWEEDISKLGRLTEQGYKHLFALWNQLNEAAMREGTDWKIA